MGIDTELGYFIIPLGLKKGLYMGIDTRHGSTSWTEVI